MTTAALASVARAAAALLVLALAGCAALLPRAKSLTESPWSSFQEVQALFDRIVPYETTREDLKSLGIDPDVNPNITLLNYSDVLRRFVPSPSINADDLDVGVRDCIAAKAICRGYELDQRSMRRQRDGNFVTDFLNFRRHTEITGWRFNGVLLLRDGVVVYKLSGGQPSIREQEENTNPLGPLQGIGESRIFR